MFEHSSGIIFRDRPLKPGEKYHWYCQKCKREVHPDMRHKHQCSSMKYPKN